jgi:GntR family transcriptional regulator/MocR family aminotransferase
VNAIHRERHQLLANAITPFAEHLELVPSTAGLHLTALARKMSVDQIAAIARRAADRGVAIQILSHFAVSAIPRAGIMLGYGAIPTTRIDEGMQLLRACFDSEPQ